MDGETLRDGIFALHTRRFGSVAEVLIQRLVKLGKARSLFHDLFDDIERHRVEVKFSVVRKRAEIPITEATVLRAIEGATSEKRMVHFDDWKTVDFDCNIQQIKRAEFDVLYYGLFFADSVAVFRIRSSENRSSDSIFRLPAQGECWRRSIPHQSSYAASPSR